jgi:site-specific DNA-methyltransferase (adenine-specific)
MWAELKRIIKPNGAIVLFGSQPFTSALIMSNVSMFKYEIIYQKTKATNYLQAKKQVMKIHENICVFYKNQSVYNPQFSKGNPYRKKHKNGNKDDCVYNKDTRKE